MPRQELLINLQESLREGVANSSAELLRRARTGALRLISHAVLTRSGDELRTIEAELGGAHTQLLLKHGWKPEPDLKAEAWMLAGASAIAGMVASLLPRQVVLTREQGTKRGEILSVLLDVNDEYLSNSDLVPRVDARPETVARVLEALRQDGLVESWRRGRTTLNRLTEAGAERARQIRAEEGKLKTPVQEKGDELRPFRRGKRMFREMAREPIPEQVRRRWEATPP